MSAENLILAALAVPLVGALLIAQANRFFQLICVLARIGQACFGGDARFQQSLKILLQSGLGLLLSLQQYLQLASSLQHAGLLGLESRDALSNGL